jgi:hypothetical protein
MNFRNNKSGGLNSLSINGESYVLVRSQIFYFLEFINYEKALFKTTSSLASSPGVIFYDNDGVDSVVLDYTNSSPTDLSYLNSLFSGMSINSGFTLSNGSYLEESKNIEADISSNLKFKEFKNSMIFAEVNSVTNKNASTDFYYGSFFIQTPQITTGLSLGSNPYTTANALANTFSNSKNILSNLGLRVGDIIEIVYNNSINSNLKLKIIQIKKIQNQEILIVDKPVSEESLKGKPVLVNLYVKGNVKGKEEINTTDQTLGCCLLGINNGFTPQLLDVTSTSSLNNTTLNINGTVSTLSENLIRNTTRQQCEIITGNSNSFFEGCVSNVSTQSSIITVNENIEYSANPFNIINISFTPQNEFNFLKSRNDLNTQTRFNYENGVLYLSPDTVYRFDQTDTTNTGKTIRFVSDNNTPYFKDVWGKNTNIGINSIIFFKMPIMSINGITQLNMIVENNLNVIPVQIKEYS